MSAVIASMFSAVVKWLLNCFMISPERKLGRLEAENEGHKKEDAVLAQALRVSDLVDGAVDDDRLRDALNNRPR